MRQIQFSLAGASSGTQVVNGSAASVTISNEGVTILTYFATDNAGNQELPKTLTVRIDNTPPTVTCAVSPNTLWPPNHKLVTVNASVSVSDALSGPAGFTLNSVTSSEPDIGTGADDTPNDIQGFGIGTPATSGSLRSERAGEGTGRVYTLSYTGSDVAGNVAVCTTTVTVPHDQR